MSNLGGYQTAVQLIKALGGPKKALTIGVAAVGVTGYGVLRLVEVGGKKSIGALRTVAGRQVESDASTDAVFIVRTDGRDGQGLEFKAGDQYKVLERDDDAILIEIEGNDDNPHIVSGIYLASISDFELD